MSILYQFYYPVKRKLLDQLVARTEAGHKWTWISNTIYRKKLTTKYGGCVIDIIWYFFTAPLVCVTVYDAGYEIHKFWYNPKWNKKMRRLLLLLGVTEDPKNHIKRKKDFSEMLKKQESKRK